MVIIMNTEREADLILYIGMLIPLLGCVDRMVTMLMTTKRLFLRIRVAEAMATRNQNLDCTKLA